MLNVSLVAFRRTARAPRTLASVNGRRYITSHSDPPEGQTAFAPITPQPQPTLTNKDGTRTLRRREHGRPLPLPPLMDPILLEAKSRYKTRKADQTEENMTDFQRELAANPYAHALTGQVRKCVATHARLPAHFLLAFWSVYTPRNSDGRERRKENVKESHEVRGYLGVEETQAAGKESREMHDPVDEDAIIKDIVRIGQERPPAIDVHLTLRPPKGISRDLSPRLQTYILNNHQLAETLTKKQRYVKDLINNRIKEHYARYVRKLADNVDAKNVWRLSDDFSGEILEHLRATVLWEIRGMLGHDTALCAPLKDTSDLPADAGAVLLTGETEPGSSDSLSVSVYDLRALIGENVQQRLPYHLRLAPSWILMRSFRTAYVQAALHRLQVFMQK